jgi:hypothetical protein
MIEGSLPNRGTRPLQILLQGPCLFHHAPTAPLLDLVLADLVDEGAARQLQMLRG